MLSGICFIFLSGVNIPLKFQLFQFGIDSVLKIFEQKDNSSATLNDFDASGYL